MSVKKKTSKRFVMSPSTHVVWIRKNIPKKKLQIVKKYLKSSERTGIFEWYKKAPSEYGYLSPNSDGLIERIYRVYHHSWKIDNMIGDGLHFLNAITFLLLPERKDIAFENDEMVDKYVKKCFSPESTLFGIYKQFVKDSKKIGDAMSETRKIFSNLRKDWGKKSKLPTFDYGKDTVRMVGGITIFYYNLKSLMETIERCYDEDYDLAGTMDWEEGITLYVLYELKDFHQWSNSPEGQKVEKEWMNSFSNLSPENRMSYNPKWKKRRSKRK